MKPARAACLASAGIASSRLPSTTSTSRISSGTLARIFSMCGGTKWIMRSSRTGSSRRGVGAPIASGWKKRRGNFTWGSGLGRWPCDGRLDQGRLELGRLAVRARPCQKPGRTEVRGAATMSDLVGLFNLLAPFFGLILLGFVSAKRARLPESGLAWMQFFLVYLALPALFYRLTSAQPIDEFANGRFVAVTTFATASAFTLSFAASLWRQGRLSQGVMGGLAGSYSNIGYMGPPLVLSFLGPEAT